jgi:beta-mannosidase
MFERSAQWIDETDWLYEGEFFYDQPVDCPVYIKFHGLDTIAEISLNGTPIASTDNMFIAHEFRIDHLLQTGPDSDGKNTIEVIFRSAKLLGIRRQQQWNEGIDAITPHWDGWAPRSLIRKAQYMFGWDWGPVLISCGIWQPVEIIKVPTARLLDWSYSFEIIDGQADIEITNTIGRTGDSLANPLRLRLTVGNETTIVDIPRTNASCTVIGNVHLSNPSLWQPNGLNRSGESPALYSLSVEIIDSQNKRIDSRMSKIGIRKIELLHQPDDDGLGEGFQFQVNGHGVFAKGANWIPNSSYPAVTNTTSLGALRERIEQARDAGFNMLRVWGGGLYETEEFYNICDELGIMVWQDFAYGCAYYPDTGEYAEAARSEAIAAVRRIRNHPSLALWCGNNENNTMYCSNWHDLSPTRHVGEKLYHKILPEVVAAESPDIPYWPSSPYGGANPACDEFGDCHNWDVWHGRGDWTNYTDSNARFCSEFGFASSCSLTAWNAVLASKDRSPRSNVVRWHDKTRKGYETYLGYVGIHYPEIETLQDLVYYSQINQADALKFGVEHYRRNMGRCWGTLFWQLNDCWPVQSWAVIDSLGQPKAAYYAAKKFYAPVLLSLKQEGESVKAYIISDLRETLTGIITLSVEAFDGSILDTVSAQIEVGPNQSKAVADIQLLSAKNIVTKTFIHGRFTANGSEAPSRLAENILLPAEPKDLELAPLAIEISLKEICTNLVEMSITARSFTPSIWIRHIDDKPLNASDNFFHVAAGETRTVTMANPDGLPLAQFAKLLLIRSMQFESPVSELIY